MTDVTSSAATEVSCKACGPLHRGSWAQEWFMPVAALERHRFKCQTCKLLYDGICAVLGPGFTALFSDIGFPTRARGDGGTFRVDLHPPEFGKLWKSVIPCRLRVYTLAGSRISWKFIGQAQHIEHPSLSAASLSMVKAWFDSCLAREGPHLNCGTETETILPKRVILVGLEEADAVKLHIPSKGETGRYVALSHCWGGSAPTRTTKTTLDQFIAQKIPTPLPKTFEDAITTTRALGIRYLWIDSLCIVQDSPEDWLEQAPAMAEVYGNADLVISADAAEDCTQGFLNHASRKLNQSMRVPYEGMTDANAIWIRQRGRLGYQLPFHGYTTKAHVPSRGEIGLELRRRTEDARYMASNEALGIQISPLWSSDRPMSNSNVQFGEVLAPVFIKSTADEILETLEKVCREDSDVTSKLSTRGWVFQEQTLSRRTLHFGESEIGWECLSMISCECSATTLRYRRTESLLKKARTVMPWVDVITQYSRLELTVPGDRLVALAGLASVRHEAAKRERYVAGMWERDLQNQIAWCAQDTGNERGLPHEYIAPSWSWASANQPVVYNHISEFEPNFMIKTIQCQPQDASLFGNCKPGACLIIKGSLVPVEVVVSGSSIRSQRDYESLKRRKQFQDEGFEWHAELSDESPKKKTQFEDVTDAWPAELEVSPADSWDSLPPPTRPFTRLKLPGRKRQRPASYSYVEEHTKGTVRFDTTARRDAVTQSKEAPTLAFFVANKAGAPYGLLLRLRGSEQDLPQETGVTAALQPSVSMALCKYERVGYISTQRSQRFEVRDERWSPDIEAQDWPGPNLEPESASSQVGDVVTIAVNGITLRFRLSLESTQTFALY